jgi:phage/plasmid-like protein (TIGR03299 family)
MSHGLTRTDSMFSVRQLPWHGLGAVLDTYPRSIDEALERSGLGWSVARGDVLVRPRLEGAGERPAGFLIRAQGYTANLRADTGEVLGIVSDDYEVVENRDAFRFLDALIGSDLYFETAGSLWGGRRVWVLARLPEHVELGGDRATTYVYVANSHDGSMAVTAAATPIRIVCANTLGAALYRSEHGVEARRTFRFRHAGDLQAKFAEARAVLGMTINYERQFKTLADRLALSHITPDRLRSSVLRHLWPIEPETGPRARRNREQTIAAVLEIFAGRGPAGDTTGNSPSSKWVAWNAVCEQLDYGRRYTARTNQVQRSFEDTTLKQRALELVIAA